MRNWNMPITAQELRDRRASLGLTQEALASCIGVHRNTVAKWERAEQKIEHPQLLEFALRYLQGAQGEEETSDTSGEVGRSFTPAREAPIRVVELQATPTVRDGLQLAAAWLLLEKDPVVRNISLTRANGGVVIQLFVEGRRGEDSCAELARRLEEMGNVTDRS